MACAKINDYFYCMSIAKEVVGQWGEENPEREGMWDEAFFANGAKAKVLFVLLINRTFFSLFVCEVRFYSYFCANKVLKGNNKALV
jgi:hypothetical protein